jgi:hypothetical protein
MHQGAHVAAKQCTTNLIESTQNPVQTGILLALWALASAPAVADLRVQPPILEVESGVLKCLKSVDFEDKVTYWTESEETKGEYIFEQVKPDKFALVVDLGEVEIEETLKNGKIITYKAHESEGVCTFY